MFRRMSLSKKLLVMGLTIGSIVPFFSAFIYFKTAEVTSLNDTISQKKLPKTKILGELGFKFRDIRIQVRTLPVQGMTWADVDLYVEKTKTTLAAFLEVRKEYENTIETEAEKKLFKDLDVALDDFSKLGGTLIALAATHDDKKMTEISQLVREVCPKLASKVESAITTLVEAQTTEAKGLVRSAQIAESQMTYAILIGCLVGFLIAVLLSTLVARTISRELQTLAEELAGSSIEVTKAAESVSSNGKSLSTTTTNQSATLQETVSAIEEISSMVSKNSENASQSQQTASQSLSNAENGKVLIEDLISEVKEIQKGTAELFQTVEDGNREMNKIIGLISEIETKTKVINDIVFQTKLLSFNASVEAARAGESGKGFAVVAEEVGNLAAMSGKSAKEISDLLASSMQMVNEIITSIKSKVESQTVESRNRVERGIEMGLKCGENLNIILEGAQRVNSSVSEIALASHEQASGVTEVTKAMHQMNTITNENAKVSSSSAIAAEKLNTEALLMKDLVDRLYVSISGSGSKDSKRSPIGPNASRDGNRKTNDENSENVYHLRRA
jgi:methyl-accepting chemotaxis protein